MIFAIISDIHSNKEALDAVLAGHRGRGRWTPSVALGTSSGTDPIPNDCAREVFARCGSIVGAIMTKRSCGLIDLEWFNSTAREAALWNRRNAAEETLAAAAGLPKGPVELDDGVVICHGTPVDEDEYMLSSSAVEESYRWIDGRQAGDHVLFPRALASAHGHSSAQGGRKPVQVHRNGKRNPPESRKPAYLINPGSVGQPRDGNPRASFGIFDTKSLVYRNLRVAYPVEETQRKIFGGGASRRASVSARRREVEGEEGE